MPLPAALQARLKRRGLVVQEHKLPDGNEDNLVVKKKKNYKQQPLPPGWFKVPDIESGHDYFWNVHTNQVAWRHPNDPRAEITYPAIWKQQQQQHENSKENVSKEPKDIKDAMVKKEKQKVKTGKHPSLLKAQRQKGRKQGRDDDTLDPMDPAAYSDVGRGTWSSGLREDSEVNTGVDTTANGPLFQQRPYPSPGDILRRNKGKPPSGLDEDE